MQLKHTLLCCSASFDELALQVRQFIDKLAPGSLVADVGCGNGKYFLVRQDIAVLGSDRSSGLAEVAATRLAAGTGAASGTPCCITSRTRVFGTACLEPRTARQAKGSVRRKGVVTRLWCCLAVVLFSCVIPVCKCEQHPKVCTKHALMGQNDQFMEYAV